MGLNRGEVRTLRNIKGRAYSKKSTALSKQGLCFVANELPKNLPRRKPEIKPEINPEIKPETTRPIPNSQTRAKSGRQTEQRPRPGTAWLYRSHPRAEH